MEEIGVIKSVNEKKNTARVVFSRKSACDKCGMCLKSKDDMTVYIDVKNTISAKVGDKVAVVLGDSFVLKAAFIVYIIPVILVGIAIAVGRSLNELIQFAIVLGALFLGLIISILLDKLIKNKKGYAPKLERVILKEEDNE
jgi:sigma-E factor negative regulatory protein RseC